MSSASRYETIVRRASWACLALGVVITAGLVSSYVSLPAVFPKHNAGAGNERGWPQKEDLSKGVDWLLFRGGAGGGVGMTSTGGGPLASRFRLAGIFLISLEGTGADTRKAIIDDLRNKNEQIVSVGDILGSVQVAAISDDRVLLREGGMQEEILLNFGSLASSASTGPVKPAVVERVASTEALSTNAFGAQTGADSWEVNRDALETYANEIEQHPARLAALFDSMKPVYEVNPETGRQEITGHKLHIEGEGDFYTSVGLRENDVVKSVNGMPITSKRRAMFWINQFRDGQVNTFAMDVVRDGTPTTLQYTVK